MALKFVIFCLIFEYESQIRKIDVCDKDSNSIHYAIFDFFLMFITDFERYWKSLSEYVKLIVKWQYMGDEESQIGVQDPDSYPSLWSISKPILNLITYLERYGRSLKICKLDGYTTIKGYETW